MMVVKGLRYLSQSEKFKDNSETNNNIKSIKNDFNLLSELFFMETIRDRNRDETRQMVSENKKYLEITSSIKKIDNASPIPLDYPHDVTFDSNFKKTQEEDRENILKELFAIHNKIEYTKNISEKKNLVKKQNQLRKSLQEIDKVLELLTLKRTLQCASFSLFVNPQIDLDQFLSNDEPNNSKWLLNQSKILMEKL